jgi:hypothetical protein
VVLSAAKLKASCLKLEQPVYANVRVFGRAISFARVLIPARAESGAKTDQAAQNIIQRSFY